MFEELLADEDGAVTAEGQCDGIRGTRVEGDDFPALIHPDRGVEGVFAESAYDHAGDASVEAVDDVAEEVVRHRPWGCGFLDLQRDGIGFKKAYPDRENDFTGEIVEYHDGHLR